MTRYTLDTNTLSALINGSRQVLSRWQEVRRDGRLVTINAISYFEIRRGLELPRFARKFIAFERLVEMHGMLPLELAALDTAADLYQLLRARGELIEDADILIAGIALANDATLVTRNTKHFERIEGLGLENWET